MMFLRSTAGNMTVYVREQRPMLAPFDKVFWIGIKRVWTQWNGQERQIRRIFVSGFQERAHPLYRGSAWRHRFDRVKPRLHDEAWKRQRQLRHFALTLGSVPV